ncbi:helix-turn-helix domain-containing protein [Paenibacillus sp. LjRoot56]|uniref:helix-turn-helix domain-containing protein n=1 Tax=Paenibacillus sp. LjRoot56 TaxID=3342333 RepID=UPI003ECC5786
MLPKSLVFFRQHSIFVKWLLILNIVILISIVTVGGISYVTSSSLLIEESEHSSSVYLEQARDNTDKEILVLDSMTQQIALQPNTRRTIYQSSNGEVNNEPLYAELVKYLSSVKLSNPIVANLWLDPTKESFTISNDAKYEKDFFYSSIFPFHPNKNEFNQKRSQFGVSYLGAVKVNDTQQLLFGRPAPIEETVFRGVIYASVDGSKFLNGINSSKLGDDTGVFITDSLGNIVIKNNRLKETNEEKIGEILKDIMKTVNDKQHSTGSLHVRVAKGKEYLVVYTSSNVNDWNYMSMVPITTITEKSRRIQSITIVAVLICLACGLIVSYMLTRRIYEPINRIIQYINVIGVGGRISSNRENKQNELVFINQLIDTVHNRYESLKNTFEQQVPALRQKFLNDLIEGRAYSAKWEETTTSIQLDLPFPSFQLIVFESMDFFLNQIVSSGETIMEAFDEAFSRFAAVGLSIHYVPKHNNMIVVIVNLDLETSDPEKIFEFAHHVNVTFERLYHKKFTVGIGRAYDTHSNIPHSYLEALSALHYKVVKGQGEIIFVDEVPVNPQTILNYSLDMEKQLINQLKTSDIDESRKSLDRILSSNLGRELSSPELIQQLFRALAGTTVRTIYEIGATMEVVLGSDSRIYSDIDKSSTVEAKRKVLIQAFEAIQLYIQDRTENQYEKLFANIREYVEQHYNEELSLPQLGKELKMSPTYLSSKFKEITGMKFVDFVNIRRIEQAKTYLKSTEDPVQVIAEKVGFVNANTFIKVFKKHEGVTPGQYRSLP